MPAAEPGRITVRELLGRPIYRRWWGAAVISRAGDILAGVTLLLLVLDRTGSGLGVAGVVIADVVPVLLFAPVAGVVVDRLPRRRIMIAADLVRMTLAALLPLVGTHLGAVYAIAFALSAATVFFNPAANSLLPALVGERELVAANSGIWTTAIVAQIALAPLAGALAAVAGYAAAFWVNAASFAISAMLLTGLAVPGHRVGTTSQGWARDALDGVRLLVADRLMRSLATAQLLAALSAGATSALLVVLIRERLGLGPQGFGWLLASIAVGALAGPALLTRIMRGPVRPGIVFGAYGVRGLVDVLLALTTWPLLAAAALLFYGLSTSAGTITFTSLVQTHTGEAARGRVFAGFDALFQTGRLVSLLMGGVLADWLGITAVYFLGAALLLTAAASGFSPRRSSQAT
ncbi:MFS transporter [Saccharopolyspora spinosa]|uniref:MFS family arabinose efflux permease n=1 Tax=Saccharopolyspora spinosa TaxID=60894 RepID=A0A2N3Y3N0_SACSN|nr:MFS transporter [Saccharopolyspora spinosa]PKW17421.1 putative MFS family arabinose efflux permease [Saccharopolyspora spinosa]